MTSRLLRRARRTTARFVRATGGLYPMTLIKQTRQSTGINLADPGNPVSQAQEKRHPFQGIYIESAKLRADSAIIEDEKVIEVIAGFLPNGINPEPNDFIESEGERQVITRILESDSTEAVFRVAVK